MHNGLRYTKRSCGEPVIKIGHYHISD
ncbi:hypothetical protein O0I10_009355, partial [Lichtheimia ornata]